MDEQRLRARLAALDIAQQLTGFGVNPEEIEGIPKLAGWLEEWLMRPVPSTDVPPDDADEHGHRFRAMTAGLCDLLWQDADGPEHGCLYSADRPHTGHLCKCGDTTSTGCSFTWRKVNDDHAHRCDGFANHDGLHHCGTCGVVYLERRR